jgi:hypothetical protein
MTMVGASRLVRMVLLPCAVFACGGQRESAQRAVPPDSAKWSGLYVSDTLPAADIRGRIARLAIGPDTMATLEIHFIGRGAVLRHGVWWARGEDLTFEPRRVDGRPLESAFLWRLEGNRLVPLRWNRDVYGSGGLPLTKQAPTASAPADTAGGAPR